MSSLTELSAVNLVRGMKNKDFSCREVMQAYLEKIQMVNPIINAVVQQLYE